MCDRGDTAVIAPLAEDHSQPHQPPPPSPSSSCTKEHTDGCVLPCTSPHESDSVLGSESSRCASPQTEEDNKKKDPDAITIDTAMTSLISASLTTNSTIQVNIGPKAAQKASNWELSAPLAVFWLDNKVQDVLRKVHAINTVHSFDSLLHATVPIDPSVPALMRCALVRNDRADEVSYDLMIYNQEPAPPSVWFVFSGMGAQYPGMAAPLMGYPAFANTIYKCAEALIGTGINLVSLVTDTSEEVASMLKRPECAFVAVVAVHIALVEILATIGIFPTGYLGHSIGELTCAYISGFFSLQETIRCAYRLGFVASSCPGSMAAIGISSQRFCESEHPNVFLACDNSKDSITVSGSAASVSEYVALKKKEGVLATVIDSAGVAFHSPTLIPASNEMRRALSGILGTKRFPRPAQWVSTSQTSRGALFSSEYLVQNLLQPSMFSSAMAKLPPNAAVFEIGATPILASFIKSALPEARCVVAPMTRKSPSKLTLATALANAFSAGGVDVHSLAFLCG